MVVVKDERRWCQTCSGALHRAAGVDSGGGLCGPCQRVAAPGYSPPVPPDFYQRPALRRAVGGYDFGAVFREVRSYGIGMSQEELGFLVGLTQDTVSKVELGLRRLDKFADVVRAVTALGIPVALLNFTRTSPFGGGEGMVGWVDRRGFHKALAATALGVGATLELDRLQTLLPTAGQEPPPRRIGAEDVTAINQTTDTFRASHNERGGGLARAAAVAQLGYVLNLRGSLCSQQVRAELLIATAALANTAGWMSCQANRHEDAQRLWMIALSTAREANHPYNTDLMVHTLMNTGHQAVLLDQPREVEGLVKYATALTAMAANAPVGAETRHYVAGLTALSQAMSGHTEACLRALDEAGQIIADADADVDQPPWSSPIDAATEFGWRGRSLFRLVATDPSYAPRAIECLRKALDAYEPGRTSTVKVLAVSLPALAGSYVQAGDLDTALALGHESVTVADGLSSVTPHSWLRALDEVLEPHQQRADVAELRHRIRQVTVPTTV